MPRSSTITAHLAHWDDIKNCPKSSGILLGNGFSRTLWEPFDYPSLFQKADSAKTLTETDKALFKKLGRTTNFETILAHLLTAATVNKALGIPHSEIPRRYQSIRLALIKAVRAIHLPWNRLSDGTTAHIRKELLRYRFVFTTNYDLLLYWCIMANGANGFKDYFWNHNHTFDASNSKVWNSHMTKILYLHGALHLYRTAAGRTVKKVGGVSSGLLDRFAADKTCIPLFISEGSSHHKMQAIARSDYLSFGLKTLSEFDCSLVVFGHSLGTGDKHIIAAIRNWRHPLNLAYSIYPGKDSEIIQKKSRIVSLFPDASINFFDARTHPLGNSSLRT